MDSPEAEQSRWFADELQPHEAMLRAWLRSRFSTEGDFDDVVQEAYVRVLKKHAAGEVKSPKAFLFATARNLVLDRLRHQRVARTDSLAEIDELAVMDESPAIPEVVARAQELELLTQAIQSLPERCRQVLTLRKIYGLSQKEISARLGIAEHTVEAHGAAGLRKCMEFFARHDRVRRIHP